MDNVGFKGCRVYSADSSRVCIEDRVWERRVQSKKCWYITHSDDANGESVSEIFMSVHNSNHAHIAMLTLTL